ncbi:alpha/beta fold hydrolase [uncultured Enterovirga sp.]|uniref:alpha/beta fold hydrolase n=1 Tax=uncultured Enterovirga sp. TaxID=2026352 RepID=UPI0035CAF24C
MATFELTLPDGAVLRGHVEGHGPDMLLVSGLGGAGAFWTPVVDALADRFRLIRFDQRGIGASTRGTEPCTIATLAADAGAILAHLDAERTTLVGHSTGGCIIQEMALADPSRIAGLVLTGAWAAPNRFMTELFHARLRILRTEPRDYAAMGVFLGYAAEWLDRNWAVFDAAVAAAPVTPAAQTIVAERIEALLAFDRSRDLGAIRVPCAIVGAEDDLIVPAFLQRELSRLLPDAPLEMFESGGHFFPLTRRERFVELVARWAFGFAGQVGGSAARA